MPPALHSLCPAFVKREKIDKLYTMVNLVNISVNETPLNRAGEPSGKVGLRRLCGFDRLLIDPSAEGGPSGEEKHPFLLGSGGLSV